MDTLRLLRLEGLDDDSNSLFDALNKEDDLPCVLLSVSHLDKILVVILRKLFINSRISNELLDSNKGIIGNYSSRVRLCYVLGVISKGLYKNLISVGNIRNIMAHNELEITFEDIEIKRICDTLLLPETKGVSYSGESGESKELNPDEFFKKFKNSRHRFTFAVIFMSNELRLIDIDYPRTPVDKWKEW